MSMNSVPYLSVNFVKKRFVCDNLYPLAFLRLFVGMFGDHVKLTDSVFLYSQRHRQPVLFHQHLEARGVETVQLEERKNKEKSGEGERGRRREGKEERN